MLGAIESYAPAQLQATCKGEQCTAAALASHVALGHPIIADWVSTAPAGKPLPSVTMDDVNAMNAEQIARDANRSKEESLADLRDNGAAAIDLVRGFNDANLDRSPYFTLVDREVTTEWLIPNTSSMKLFNTGPASEPSAANLLARNGVEGEVRP